MTVETAPRKTFSFANMALGASASRADFVFPDPITREWAWGDGTGAGVRVCVIDSGVSAGRPEIGTIEGSYAIATSVENGVETFRVVPDDQGDVNGHGTACAAIIRRLAPGVRLSSVRILGPSLGAGGMTLIHSLRWAIAEKFDIVNLSLSTSRIAYKRELHDLADKAFFDGMIIVASAHNRPVESFPWTFPSVISVGSHDSSDPERLEINARPRWSSSRPACRWWCHIRMAARSVCPATVSPHLISPGWRRASGASTRHSAPVRSSTCCRLSRAIWSRSWE